MRVVFGLVALGLLLSTASLSFAAESLSCYRALLKSELVGSGQHLTYDKGDVQKIQLGSLYQSKVLFLLP